MGTVRFFLALSVVAFHLTAQLPSVGMLAVNFFYSISGFLITLILNERYRGASAAFLTNRVLRLFPAYIVCALCALLLHALVPVSRAFHPSWANGLSPGDFWGNLFIVPWAFLADPLAPIDVLGLPSLTSPAARYRLVPSSWSIGVELVCYALLWIFTARRWWTALVTILLAIVWHAYTLKSGRPDAARYFPVPAAMLPFALGSMAFYLRPQVDMWLVSLRQHSRFVPIWIVGVIAVFLGNWLLDFPSSPSTPSYIVNYFIAFAAVLAIQDTRAAGGLLAFDRLLGDLSYPMFLSHYIAAAAVFQMLPNGTPNRAWLVFAAGSLATLAMSAVIVFAVDRPISRLRDRVRPIAR